jgi:hypothetical protein
MTVVVRLAVQQQGRRRAGASILQDFTAATLTAATALWQLLAPVRFAFAIHGDHNLDDGSLLETKQ